MPRKKQKNHDTSKSKKNIQENTQENDLDQNIENKEQDIELQEEELNIDSLTGLEDLEEIDENYTDIEESDIFISEDDLIICPSCGEIIEIERLKLLEECPSCGLNISEFDEIEKYENLFRENEDEEEW